MFFGVETCFYNDDHKSMKKWCNNFIQWKQTVYKGSIKLQAFFKLVRQDLNTLIYNISINVYVTFISCIFQYSLVMRFNPCDKLWQNIWNKICFSSNKNSYSKVGWNFWKLLLYTQYIMSINKHMISWAFISYSHDRLSPIILIFIYIEKMT